MEQLEELFFARMVEFLTRTLGEGWLTPVEKQYWIHSGLDYRQWLHVLSTPLIFALRGPLLESGHHVFCFQSARAFGYEMDMLLRSCLSIAPGVPALLPGPEPLSNKVPSLLCKGGVHQLFSTCQWVWTYTKIAACSSRSKVILTPCR